MLIKGDNLESLKQLQADYENKIDVIYIDPPYNTGGKWIYNNKFADWGEFMIERLRLAEKLLSENGVFVASIDDYEVSRLESIMKAVFKNHDIVKTIVVHNWRGRPAKNFSMVHEYLLWAIPAGKDVIKSNNMTMEIRRNMRRTGIDSTRNYVPTMFYGIQVNVKTLEIIQVDDALKPDEEMRKPVGDVITVYPVDENNIQRRWFNGVKTAKQGINKTIWAKRINGKIQIYYFSPSRPKRPKSVWFGPQYDSSSHGTKLLTKIIGPNNFPYVKSLWLVQECLYAASDDKNAIILDFFAGSGTTGHAVLNMNKNDDGNRKFILCTNNENNICDSITHKRLKSVMSGYKYTGKTTKVLAEIKLTPETLRHGNALMDYLRDLQTNNYDKFEIKIMDDVIKLIGINIIDKQRPGLGGNLKYLKS